MGDIEEARWENEQGIKSAMVNDMKKALEHFRNAYKLLPNDEGILSNLSRALVEMKLTEEALEICLKRVELFPGSSGGFSNLGYVYERLDNLKEALSAYEKAIGLDPSNDDAQLGCEEVRSKLLMDSLPNVKRVKVSGSMEKGLTQEDLDKIAQAVFDFDNDDL